jgi:hypothetical protein
MAIIPIDRLEAGMILKADARDRSGRLLLPAEAELTEKHLKIFRTWGVSEADIVRGPDDEEADTAADYSAVDSLVLAEAEESVAWLFHLNDAQHPMIAELMKICLERRLANVR